MVKHLTFMAGRFIVLGALPSSWQEPHWNAMPVMQRFVTVIAVVIDGTST